MVHVHDFHLSIRNHLTCIFRYPDNRVTFVVDTYVGDEFYFIRPVSIILASRPKSRRLTIGKKSENKSPKTTHGWNLFDRAGGKRDAFEYVDWVVAHKSLLEALWDSALEPMVEEDEDRRTRRGRRKRGGRTREEPRCSGLARRVEAAGCASATWRGSARH